MSQVNFTLTAMFNLSAAHPIVQSIATRVAFETPHTTVGMYELVVALLQLSFDLSTEDYRAASVYRFVVGTLYGQDVPPLPCEKQAPTVLKTKAAEEIEKLRRQAVTYERLIVNFDQELQKKKAQVMSNLTFNVKENCYIEPQVAKLMTSEPQVVEPATTELEIAEPQVAEPQVAAEPAAIEPQVAAEAEFEPAESQVAAESRKKRKSRRKKKKKVPSDTEEEVPFGTFADVWDGMSSMVPIKSALQYVRMLIVDRPALLVSVAGTSMFPEQSLAELESLRKEAVCDSMPSAETAALLCALFAFLEPEDVAMTATTARNLTSMSDTVLSNVWGPIFRHRISHTTQLRESDAAKDFVRVACGGLKGLLINKLRGFDMYKNTLELLRTPIEVCDARTVLPVLISICRGFEVGIKLKREGRRDRAGEIIVSVTGAYRVVFSRFVLHLIATGRVPVTGGASLLAHELKSELVGLPGADYMTSIDHDLVSFVPDEGVHSFIDKAVEWVHNIMNFHTKDDSSSLGLLNYLNSGFIERGAHLGILSAVQSQVVIVSLLNTLFSVSDAKKVQLLHEISKLFHTKRT
jgi:hypothetical protein